MKKLVIYDLDGTLVDTRKDIACAANHLLKVLERPQMQDKDIWRHVGRGVHFLIGGILQTEDPKEIEKGIRIYRKYYGEHMLDYAALYPGAKELLEFFKDRLQAVITNKPNPYSVEILKALGIDQYFVEVVAGDSVLYPKKPDPTAVIKIMKREKVSLQETLFIGDSLVDIETGRNAGVDTAIVAQGFEPESELHDARPDLLVKNFSELMTSIQKRGW